MIAKVLTLEQAIQWGRGPIWLQERNYNFCYCVLYDLENVPYLRFKICDTRKMDRHLKYEARKYGKSWRCFDVKPSAHDLRLPFEEDENEHSGKGIRDQS